MRLVISLALVALLAGCSGRLWVRQDPPMVTPCLEAPTAHVADEPAAPVAGAPIPDTYVVALKAWANGLLAVITADRIAWRAERRCVGRLKDAELVR